jgi:hypothetical protein
MTSVKTDSKATVSNYWNNDTIKKLEEVLESLGDELDSIMVSKTISVKILFGLTF